MANVCEVGDPQQKATSTETVTDQADAEVNNPVKVGGKTD